MTTVADVLAAKPSLRERAKLAHRSAVIVEEARREAEEFDLMVEARQWLLDEAGCNEAELLDLEFVTGPYNSDGVRRVVHFELDGVRMRARYEKQKIMEVKSDSFASETIYDTKLRVEATKKGNTWVQVKSLADIGDVIA